MTIPSSALPASTAPDPVVAIFMDALRKHRRLTFVLADDLGSHHGMVNRRSAVVLLDDRNTNGEMRATLTHELQHLLDPDGTEEEIEDETARLLVPLDAALAAQGHGDYCQVADALFVDEALVRARLRTAEPDGAAG